jgi:hypothetical protein
MSICVPKFWNTPFKGLKGKDLRAVWPFYRLPNIKINLKGQKSEKWAKK